MYACTRVSAARRSGPKLELMTSSSARTSGTVGTGDASIRSCWQRQRVQLRCPAAEALTAHSAWSALQQRPPWQRTLQALERITGHRSRLAGNPMLAWSIAHRFPYLDPLNHLQIELIRRWRSGQQDPRTQIGIHLSINGIATSLRNTG